MPYANPEDRRQFMREYRRKHPRSHRPHTKLSQEELRKRRLARQSRWRKANRERSSAMHLRWRHTLRKTVISMYGGECACCGEDEFAFLAIDHIGGGGSRHIRSYKQYAQYLGWLRAEKREGFRVLCHNCNMARARYDACPHGNGI